MFCSKCGFQLADDANWCSKYGNAVSANNQTVQANVQFQQNINQTHNVPKCTCCGRVGEMTPGPLFRKNDIIWMLLLFITMFGGFLYLAYILITRSNPKKREKICPNCHSKNMYTYVY